MKNDAKSGWGRATCHCAVSGPVLPLPAPVHQPSPRLRQTRRPHQDMTPPWASIVCPLIVRPLYQPCLFMYQTLPPTRT